MPLRLGPGVIRNAMIDESRSNSDGLIFRHSTTSLSPRRTKETFSRRSGTDSCHVRILLDLATRATDLSMQCSRETAPSASETGEHRGRATHWMRGHTTLVRRLRLTFMVMAGEQELETTDASPAE